MNHSAAAEPSVQRGSSQDAAIQSCSDLPGTALSDLLHRFGLDLGWVAEGAEIPGSHWGAPEAGLLRGKVWVRGDTPVHSALHESCHLICMDDQRRAQVDTDAGGEDFEEDAVCYLQILLADQLPTVGRDRLIADMDAWGYSFRLGSARAWFEQDAEEARAWLIEQRLINPEETPTWRLR